MDETPHSSGLEANDPKAAVCIRSAGDQRADRRGVLVQDEQSSPIASERVSASAGSAAPAGGTEHHVQHAAHDD